MLVVWLQIFREKNAKRKSTMQVFINDNARFKEKVFSSNTFGRMQIWTKKDEHGEPYWWWFRKSSSDESGSESDNHSNDETESDDEKDND